MPPSPPVAGDGAIWQRPVGRAGRPIRMHAARVQAVSRRRSGRQCRASTTNKTKPRAILGIAAPAWIAALSSSQASAPRHIATVKTKRRVRRVAIAAGQRSSTRIEHCVAAVVGLVRAIGVSSGTCFDIDAVDLDENRLETPKRTLSAILVRSSSARRGVVPYSDKNAFVGCGGGCMRASHSSHPQESHMRILSAFVVAALTVPAVAQTTKT